MITVLMMIWGKREGTKRGRKSLTSQLLVGDGAEANGSDGIFHFPFVILDLSFASVS